MEPSENRYSDCSKQMEAKSTEFDMKAALLNAKYAALTSRARTEQAQLARKFAS
jgi:hypothetical protein